MTKIPKEHYHTPQKNQSQNPQTMTLANYRSLIITPGE